MLARLTTVLACAYLTTLRASAEERPSQAAADLLWPRMPRNVTRVSGTIRPFFNANGPGAGAISSFALERYFASPWKLGVELAPLALVGESSGFGAIAHTRVRGAFVTDYVEFGLGIGARLQRYGQSGWSVAPNIRLGSLDGINLRGELGYALIRNYYTNEVQFAWATAQGELDVPLTRKLALTVEGALGVDLWAYAMLGMKHMFAGDGGRGSIVVGSSFGFAWVTDRFPCQYGNVDPCRGAAWGFGPSFALSLEHRF